jgi:protein-S-isoprenylcysteine O-methyltransferase Ste14
MSDSPSNPNSIRSAQRLKFAEFPPMHVVVSLIGSFVLAFGVPQANRMHGIEYQIVGAICVVLGLVLSGSQFRRFLVLDKTEVSPRAETHRVLMTNGLYRFSRNPLYLGMVIAIIGFVLLSSNLVAWIFPIAFVLNLQVNIIPFEERSLTETFGEQYLAYKAAVPRWILWF